MEPTENSQNDIDEVERKTEADRDKAAERKEKYEKFKNGLLEKKKRVSESKKKVSDATKRLSDRVSESDGYKKVSGYFNKTKLFVFGDPVLKQLNKALFESVAGSHDNWLEWTEGGDQDLIEELIADGATLNYYSDTGNNAFHEACSKGQLQTIQTLLKHFPELIKNRNKHNRSIATITAITQKTETMLLLIPYGLEEWFNACVAAQWDGVQIADLVLRLEKEQQMSRKKIDKVIITDYEKLENSAKREIAKHRPAIKEIIVAAQNSSN